ADDDRTREGDEWILVRHHSTRETVTEMVSRAVISLSQFAALALWLGAAAFFSSAVAPAHFAVLPTRTLAGEVVGRLLPTIFFSGMTVGASVAAVEVFTRGAWHWRGIESAGTVMVLACAVGQFIIAPRIERIRAEIGGPIDALAIDDARRVAFGRLHGISVAWLGLAMLAAAVAMVVSARAAQSQQR
ncbi:MAG: DUF4149 domain-containing protein, partial [Gemmatimonadaceae bacterium]